MILLGKAVFRERGEPWLARLEERSRRGFRLRNLSGASVGPLSLAVGASASDDLYEAGVVVVVTTTTSYEAEEAAGCQRRGVSATRSS